MSFQSPLSSGVHGGLTLPSPPLSLALTPLGTVSKIRVMCFWGFSANQAPRLVTVNLVTLI